MKILLIDNSSSYLPKLKKLLKPRKVVSWEGLSDKYPGFDLIVLSGGHQLSVNWHNKAYAKEIRLIRKIKTPLIGICLGSELIAHTFGAKLHLLKQRDHGIRTIQDLKSGRTFRVFESHRWAIVKIPKILVALARSKDGIEIFKHKTKPIFGLQFHPEVSVSNNDGRKLYNSIFIGLSRK